MKHSLRTKLSFAIAIIVLLTVSLISFLSNVLIEMEFNHYITIQQKNKIQEIIHDLNQQYKSNTDSWNTDYIHSIGMSSVYDGYIIKVIDKNGEIIWDAQKHDMSLCEEIMSDISNRMETLTKQKNGKIMTETYPIKRNNEEIGEVKISYYGPFFFSENDFEFLHALNIILLVIGSISMFVAILIGIIMARRLSRPILKTVEAAKHISDGNYNIRIDEKTNTSETSLLIQSINNLAGSLENQEKLRKKLTEDVSHELRTPIAILQSHMEAMAEGVWEPTVERLESCNEEVRRIGALVTELEKLAKIENDNIKLTKGKVNLAELIKKVVQSFEVSIANKKLQVSTNLINLEIIADYDKMKQVMVNLLSNAIKYTEDGGLISITIEETKEAAMITICDTGIGIPKDELPFIFERFYRADKSRNRKTGGSGLGLAIVESIIKAHGGKITVQSELNKGSCFAIRLPKQ